MTENEYYRRIGKVIVSSSLMKELKKKIVATGGDRSDTTLEKLVLKECKNEILSMMSCDSVLNFNYTECGELLTIKSNVKAVPEREFVEVLESCKQIRVESPMGLMKFCISLDVSLIGRCKQTRNICYTINSIEGYSEFMTMFINYSTIGKTLIQSVNDNSISSVGIADKCRENGAILDDTSDVIDVTNIFCELRKGRLMC